MRSATNLKHIVAHVPTHHHHAMGVHSVAFSPDSWLMVVGGFDGAVKVWDVSGLRPLLLAPNQSAAAAAAASSSVSGGAVPHPPPTTIKARVLRAMKVRDTRLWLLLCCAVLCCVVLCWAVLCCGCGCAVLCCAVLCCAVLCYGCAACMCSQPNEIHVCVVCLTQTIREATVLPAPYYTQPFTPASAAALTTAASGSGGSGDEKREQQRTALERELTAFKARFQALLARNQSPHTSPFEKLDLMVGVWL